MMTSSPKSSRPFFQLKISLADSQPLIWRRIVIPVDFTLGQLHWAIQAVMPWLDCHLHEFRIRDAYYGRPDLEERDDQLQNETTMTLSKALRAVRSFIYLYDFGDDWRHTIQVEKRLTSKDGESYPVCLAGENACPPENSGSLWGYYDKLAILGNRRHPAYAETREWMPDQWDPVRFVLAEANQELKRFMTRLNIQEET